MHTVDDLFTTYARSFEFELANRRCLWRSIWRLVATTR